MLVVWSASAFGGFLEASMKKDEEATPDQIPTAIQS